MEEKCLRNMSCKCRLCAGEDIAALMSISKAISSNITYDDGEEGEDGDALPPPPTMGRMTNSPPIPAARKAPVANSPPIPAARKAPVANSPPRNPPAQRKSALPPRFAQMRAAAAAAKSEPMEVDAAEDVTMKDSDDAPMVPVMPPPAPPVAMAVESSGSTETAGSGTDAADGVSVDEIVAKVTDKNWKLRKEGFDQVKAYCERSGVRNDDVVPFLELFSKMCEDANASAMEAGIQAVLAYTVNVEPFQKSVVPGVMKRVTDKGFSSRPGTVKLCEELVQAFIEAGAAEDTVNALIEGTKNKKPKVPPACAQSILDALKAFGPRVVPLPAVKAALPALCESTVNGVRPIALNILVEIHRWTGPALVQDIVSNLRQAQQTEYEGLTNDLVVGQAAPTKFVRGAKRPSAAAGLKAAAGGGAAASASATAAFDPREFAETVNLLAKLPKTEFKAKLDLPKWSEKVEALKIVLDLIGAVPKLANDDYYELVNTLKILSNDSNVNIVAKSVEVLGALSDGLRKNFTQYARMMFPELMRKLSDKKSVILNATNNTLDLFLQHSMTIDMMMEEIKLALDALKNKAPSARVQTIGFLTRCIEKNMVNLGDKSLMLEFGGLFVASMDDTDPTVRKAGLDSFIVILKASSQISEWLQGMLDDISRKNPRSFKTIQQSVGGSVGAAKASAGAASAAPAAAKKPVAEVIEVETSAPAASAAARPGVKKPVRAAPSRLGAAKAGAEAPSKPAAAAAKRSAAGAGGGSSGGSGSTDFTPMAISVAPEDAEGILVEMNIDNWIDIKEGFASAKWMERKTAIEGLETFAKENSGVMSMVAIEALTVFMSKQVKDFKDSNINVLKSAFQAVGTFAENAASKFPRGVICQVVPSAADKISDRKAAEAIRTMVLQLCEATSPSYVLGCLLSHMPNVKAPLAHIEVLTVVADCIKDFGVAVCNPRMLIDFVKGSQGLESSNPKVRTGAIAVLAVMYSQLGPALLPILNLESWKPALASIVEAEFKKVGYDPASAMAGVKRQVKGDEDEGGGKKKVDPGALFGRADISSQITKELLADMKCEEDIAAWKKRSAAMDSVQSICEAAGGAIEFTKQVQELLRALKARLSDSNANLKVKAAQVIGVVASSIGPDVGKMSKFLGASLLSGVSDNKKTMQAAAIEALHKWVRHNNQTSSACMESLLSAVSEALLNPVGRAELLGWAAEHLKNCEKLDLSGLVAPVVQCLMDKSSEAREKAQLVLAEVIKSVGKDAVLTTGCRDIKPAQMRTLRPLIQKVCDSVAETAVTAAPAVPVAPATPVPQIPPTVTETPTRTGLGASRLAKGSSLLSKGAPGGVRSQLMRPGSFRSADSGSDDGEPSPPTALLKMNSTKSARLAKGQFNKWVFESTNVSEMNNRKAEVEAEWKPYLSPDFHAKLFAPTLEKGMMAAVTDLMTCASQQPQEVLAALDLILKWCTLRIVDNNVQALAKLLEFLVKLFEMLKGMSYQLDDVEASIFLPYLLQESGQSKPRFRVRFRDIMKLVVDVYSPEKYVNYLMECFIGCKNMKSRCECIDLIEYIVTAHGFHVLGKKCVKEVGKYVTAHEKELRESAINALVAVYTRTDGNLDKFFRFTGVTTQQGMDLLNARIKHLPPGSLQECSGPVPPQQPSFGFGAAPSISTSFQSNVSVPATTPPRMPAAVSALTPASGIKQYNSVAYPAPVVPPPIPRMPQDEDTEMMSLSIHDEQEADTNDTIEELLLRPIDLLMTDAKEIVDERSPYYADGIDALKGLYAIIDRPSGESELEFLRYYVNDIFIKLCDLIHGSFCSVESKKPLVIQVLSLSLPILNLLLNSEAIENIQRYAVERIILEICSKMLDPRVEEFASKTSTASLNMAKMPAEKKRFLLLFKALVKALRGVTENVKAGEVYPSVINLLQRIVRNDVGDYNSRDAYNHLMKSDSLDQLVGRLLIQISKTQANALNPYDGIDIFGVLMQMHSFFSTLPQTDLFAVQIANDNMQSALRIITEALMKTRRSSFEASLVDLPMASPVRELLASMGFSQNQQPSATDSTLYSATNGNHNANGASSGYASRLGGGASAAPISTADLASEPVTRRLFDAGPSSGLSASSSTTSYGQLNGSRESLKSRMALDRQPSGVSTSSAVANVRSSFTSFNDFAASRSSSVSSIRSSFTSSSSSDAGGSVSTSTSTTTQLLRERLEKVRKF
ncbi:Cytoskeleton-associated protein, partial [Globisporangium splendens]